MRKSATKTVSAPSEAETPASAAPAPAPTPTPASAPPPPPPSEDNNPAHTIRYGHVRVLICKTESPRGSSFTVALDRTWRDETGNELSGPAFPAADLYNLAKATNEARRWVEWQQSRPPQVY